MLALPLDIVEAVKARHVGARAKRNFDGISYLQLALSVRFPLRYRSAQVRRSVARKPPKPCQK
jgi:hypothetical protein